MVPAARSRSPRKCRREAGRGVLRGFGHQHLRSRSGKTGFMSSPAWVIARRNEASLNPTTRAYGRAQQLTISDFPAVIVRYVHQMG